MQKEIWGVVSGYEGVYEVSNLGRVKSLGRVVLRGRNQYYKTETIILKQFIRGKYLQVQLYKDGFKRTFNIHYLVCFVFLGFKRTTNKIVLDHINNDQLDNRLVNLQVITQRKNVSKENRGNSKYTGVHFYKRNKNWVSYITINNKRKHLGYFTNEYDAHLAYQKALKQIKMGLLQRLFHN